MKHLKIWMLILGGCALIAFGFTLMSSTTLAQEDEEREELEYVGSDECSSCHRDLTRTHRDSLHARALQEGDDEGAIVANFEAGADVRSVTFPGDDEARPFEAEDVAYTIGTGKYTQMYVFEVDRGEYYVFPARWDAVAGQWEEAQLAEQWPDPAYDFVQNCAGCHTVGLDMERGRWEEEGVQCESCHGPASAHLDAIDDLPRNPTPEEEQTVRDAIASGNDPQVCGACHSVSNPPFSTEYQPGDELTATRDLIMPEDGVHWYPSGHGSFRYMQYNEWLLGHADALEVVKTSEFAEDSCLKCHSGDAISNAQRISEYESGDRDGTAPAALTVETAQYGVTCQTCHNPHQEEEEARPFNLRDDANDLCESCHNTAGLPFIHHPSREMYEGRDVIPSVIGIPSTHFTIANGPNCVTCHMPEVPLANDTNITRAAHSMQPIMPGTTIDVENLQDECSKCHEAQADPAALQHLIDAIQEDTTLRLRFAREAITDSTPDWVKQALDFVEGDGSLGVHNYSYTDALLDAVDAELGLTGSEGE